MSKAGSRHTVFRSAQGLIGGRLRMLVARRAFTTYTKLSTGVRESPTARCLSSGAQLSKGKKSGAEAVGALWSRTMVLTAPVRRSLTTAGMIRPQCLTEACAAMRPSGLKAKFVVRSPVRWGGAPLALTRQRVGSAKPVLGHPPNGTVSEL